MDNFDDDFEAKCQKLETIEKTIHSLIEEYNKLSKSVDNIKLGLVLGYDGEHITKLTLFAPEADFNSQPFPYDDGWYSSGCSF